MRSKHKPSPRPIRVVNTRTGARTTATDGKDAARILKIESDRRGGIELAERRMTIETPGGEIL